MDARDRAAMNGGDQFDGRIVKFTSYDENDYEVEYELPGKYEVCGLCHGRGTHVNPSIDSHGLTAEDFAEDPDFAEDYFGGAYDEVCNQCHGKRVETVVDRDTCDPELLKKYDQYLDDQYDAEQERYWQQRLGY